MTGLDTLDRKTREKLAFSGDRRHLQPDRLRQEVIRPRLQKLGNCFENARAPDELQGPPRCGYRPVFGTRGVDHE